VRFTNPIISGFNPDPSICRVGEDYFLVTSSFEYFPGVPLYHSRDLVNWRQIGYCLTRPSQLPLEGARASGGIFAPTIRYHDGTFYMTTTNVTGGGHFIVHTRDPFGEWSEPVWVDQDGIDPSLFFEGGQVYFSSNVGQAVPDPQKPEGLIRGIQQSIIDIETGRRLRGPEFISTGSGGQYPEAPHLYHIGKYYYLLLAEGGTEYGHMVTIARAYNPWGPFEDCPHNPILTHRSYNSLIQVTGHADLVQAQDDSWWLVCLGVRPNGYPPCYHLGRETFLAPVRWSENGWPIVGDNGRIAIEMEGPTLPPHPWPPANPRDDFNGPDLELSWNFLRNPRPEDWSLTDRPGWLRLTGSAVTLDEVGSPAFVGRRQQHFNCTVTALLDFTPQHDWEEAGLTVRMNERHHYEVAVTRRNGQRYVTVRRRIGSLQSLVAQEILNEDGPIELQIRADRDWYRFFFKSQDGQPVPLAEGETRYLSTEVAGGFTGVYIGMYATGNGQPSSKPAFWDWFEYRPEETQG
jgi:alpha-N-arabinofuranosidase